MNKKKTKKKTFSSWLCYYCYSMEIYAFEHLVSSILHPTPSAVFLCKIEKKCVLVFRFIWNTANVTHMQCVYWTKWIFSNSIRCIIAIYFCLTTQNKFTNPKYALEDQKNDNFVITCNKAIEKNKNTRHLTTCQ